MTSEGGYGEFDIVCNLIGIIYERIIPRTSCAPGAAQGSRHAEGYGRGGLQSGRRGNSLPLNREIDRKTYQKTFRYQILVSNM